jgi:hypothetical protein
MADQVTLVAEVQQLHAALLFPSVMQRQYQVQATIAVHLVLPHEEHQRQDQQVVEHLHPVVALQGCETHHTSVQRQEYQQQYSYQVDRYHYHPLHQYQQFRLCLALHSFVDHRHHPQVE